MYPPFRAAVAGTTAITVTGSSVATALPNVSGDMLLMRAAVSNTVDVAYEIVGSASGTVVLSTGTPLSPGEICLIPLGPSDTHIALIAGTTGQSVKITRGNGE